MVFWESSENQFGRPNKKVDKIFNFFLKICPPRETPISAPGGSIHDCKVDGCVIESRQFNYFTHVDRIFIAVSSLKISQISLSLKVCYCGNEHRSFIDGDRCISQFLSIIFQVSSSRVVLV